ncbi:HD domain-containing phosphohydrolase [Geodermatophilus sp. URMC 64]
MPVVGTVCRAEVLGALSLATDLGMGQPLEHGLRAAVVAVRLGEAAGAEPRVINQAHTLSLLRFIGCTADAHTQAHFYGDEIRASAAITPAFYGRPVEALRVMVQQVAAESPVPTRLRRLAEFGATSRRRFLQGVLGHCEVARMLAEQLGIDTEIQALLTQVFERWDGRGMPAGLRGEEIALPARIMHIARDAAAVHFAAGRPAAVEVVRRRGGGGFDPRLAATFCAHAAHILEPLDRPSVWDLAIGAEPGGRAVLDDAAIDRACAAMADFTDLKSFHTPGHSRAVADLAAAAAERLGLPAQQVSAVRRAGLVHDLGRVAVPVTVWDKAGPLTRDEWEKVRLHAYLTGRVLEPSPFLRSLATTASSHHERLDGSGYHRGSRADAQPLVARLLAAADVYQAMTETRAHRPPVPRQAAARGLLDGVRGGALDGSAVDAVLAVAGHVSASRRTAHVAGLTDRETEVLVLLAHGLTTRQIARRLGMAPKTADHHIQRIYAKLGVSTRAAATVFAMQHDLVPA